MVTRRPDARKLRRVSYRMSTPENAGMPLISLLTTSSLAHRNDYQEFYRR